MAVISTEGMFLPTSYGDIRAERVNKAVRAKDYFC